MPILMVLVANGERRARGMMDELCPHGRRAEIMLSGEAEGLPGDHPRDHRCRVALDGPDR